jgi:hypothetical protein
VHFLQPQPFWTGENGRHRGNHRRLLRKQEAVAYARHTLSSLSLGQQSIGQDGDIGRWAAYDNVAVSKIAFWL